MFLVFLVFLSIFSNSQAQEERIDVFERGELGYFCFKIPNLVKNSKDEILAVTEARKGDCSDSAPTDLVFKKSGDGGKTWSSVQFIQRNNASTKYVYGNSAPVLLRENGRLLVPFCKNNKEVFLTISDDDGETWSTPEHRAELTKEHWRWVGLGPPASIQLRSGRIIVPSYHSYLSLDGEFTHSHVLISDDGGNTWRIGGSLGGIYLSNECQVVELGTDNHLLLAARGLLTWRLQSYSTDGGETWGRVSRILTEPLEGCEGSIVRNGADSKLYFSIPKDTSPLRLDLSLFCSEDEGKTWNFLYDIEKGRASYSALMPLDESNIAVLYERTNNTKILSDPDFVSFKILKV